MKKQDILIAVAHPDDETIFFGGLIQRLSKDCHVQVYCATNGNSKNMGEERRQDLRKACKQLGAQSVTIGDLPDIFNQRLDQSKMADVFKTFSPSRVYTHNPIGEYGHPHHQDVCFAVHKAFHQSCDVYSTCYNSRGSFSIELTQEEFKVKQDLILGLYGEEVASFLNFLPVTSFEQFARCTFEEAETIYNFFTQKEDLNEEKLSIYKPMARYLKSGNLEKSLANFFGGYFSVQQK